MKFYFIEGVKKMKRKKNQEDSLFDYVMIYLLQYVKLDKYYKEHPTFQRFAKYGVLTTITFWLAKAPMMWFFTDLLGVWYVLSGFIVGIIVTLLGFVYSEWGIWKK